MTNPRYAMSSNQLTKALGWTFVLFSGSALVVILGNCLTWYLYSSTYFNRMGQRPPVGTFEALIHNVLGTPENAYPIVAAVVLCSFAVVRFGNSYRTSRLIGWHLLACGLANVALAVEATVLLPDLNGSTIQYFAPQGAFSDLSYRANYGGLIVLGVSTLVWVGLLTVLSLLRRRLIDARYPAESSRIVKHGGVAAKPAAG